MKNKWKVLAIIFMVLFFVETAIVCFIFYIALDALELEKECAYDVCENYNSYFYDGYEKLCYCYDDYHEIAIQRYMGG